MKIKTDRVLSLFCRYRTTCRRAATAAPSSSGRPSDLRQLSNVNVSGDLTICKWIKPSVIVLSACGYCIHRKSFPNCLPCRVPVQVPPRAHFRLWSGGGAVQGELRPDVGQGDAADGGLARGPAAVGHAPPQAHPKVRLQGMYRDLTLHCILLNQCGYPLFIFIS